MRIVHVFATAVIAAALLAGCAARQSRPKPVNVPPAAGALRSSPPDVPGAPVRKPPLKLRPADVIVKFDGVYTLKGDTRRVKFLCPGCRKVLASDIVAARPARCPGCKLPLAWPKTVKCGYCGGTGKCSTCRGTGKCRVCGNAPRMLMGVKPPCDACNTTGKCAACGGKGACPFCNKGWYSPPKR